MKIKIKAFASVKDLLGFEEKELTVSEGITVSGVVSLLEKCHPSLKDIKNTLLFALNEEYCEGAMDLSDEDTIAIFPHVSGG